MTTLIIGGGLSGLSIAEAMESDGRDYLLIEARERFGGRIDAVHHGAGIFDMGPAWFWPGQPRIAALIERLGLVKFDQYYEGILTFEDATGQVQRGRGHASMQGSWRLDGGLAALTTALVDRLPPHRRRLNAQVTSLEQSPTGVIAVLANGEQIEAENVILAVPPRIAGRIGFVPDLSLEASSHLNTTPTWMAGQAKVVAVYKTAFWRDEGLSGDAMSRRGPLVEIHDASTQSGDVPALFGFIGVAPQDRIDTSLLRQHIHAQLVRLFGPMAAEPEALYLKDWAQDVHTSTQADRAPLYAHPSYGMPDVLRHVWDGRLIFAGSELATEFGGFLEGALEAAEHALELLKT